MKKYKGYIYLEAYKAINLGDDLFIRIILEKYPNQKFLMVAGKAYSKILKDYENVDIISSLPIRFRLFIENKLNIKKRNVVNKIASKCDAAVMIGGSLFIEPFYPTFNNKLYADKPFYIIGANFGPYKTEKFYEYCRKYIASATDICFRDRESFKLFSDMENVRYAPDILFAYKCPQRIENTNGIFVSLMNFTKSNVKYSLLQEDYENYIVEGINVYCIDHEPIYLVSFCELEGDKKIINNVRNKLYKKEGKNIHIISYDGTNIDEILSIINQCRIVIGTRFHSIILGLLMEKEVLQISYSVKTENMLKDLKMIDSAIPLERIREEKIKETNKLTKEKIQELQAESSNHFYSLDQFINEKVHKCKLGK